MVVSDDDRAVVGTVNLDYRSLYLHFEDAVLLYRVPENARIEEDVLDTLEKCHQVTLEDIRHEKLSMRILGILLKVLAPLM